MTETIEKKVEKNPEVVEKATRRRFTNEYKQRIAAEAEQCSQENLEACFVEKGSYFDLKDSYDAKTSKTWMTPRADYERPLGAPKGPAVRNGYTYTRKFPHALFQLDIENQTANIAWK